jgi:hypothetical protein
MKTKSTAYLIAVLCFLFFFVLPVIVITIREPVADIKSIVVRLGTLLGLMIFVAIVFVFATTKRSDWSILLITIFIPVAILIIIAIVVIAYFLSHLT